jgi:homoserine trans-succinylase
VKLIPIDRSRPIQIQRAAFLPSSHASLSSTIFVCWLAQVSLNANDGKKSGKI